MSSIGRFRLVAAVAGMGVLNLVGATVYVSPTGDPAAAGATPDAPTTLSHACEIVPAGTASEYSEIVLKSGTVESPEIYDFSLLGASATDATSMFSVGVAYVRIRSDAADADPRRLIIKGGYDRQNLRFINVAKNFQIAGITFRDFYSTAAGGVIERTAGDVIIASCDFEHNYSALRGGAVDLQKALSAAKRDTHTSSVTNCNFNFNCCGKKSSTSSGASAVYGGKVFDCNFKSNSGTFAVSHSLVRDSHFIENLSGGVYGSIVCDSWIISNRIVSSSVVSDYHATGASRANDGWTLELTGCHSQGNFDPEVKGTTDKKAGAIYWATAIKCEFEGEHCSTYPAYVNCVMSESVFRGDYSGGVVGNGSTVSDGVFTNLTCTTLAYGTTCKRNLIVCNRMSGYVFDTCPLVDHCLVLSNNVNSVLYTGTDASGSPCENCSFIDNVGTGISSGFNKNYGPFVQNCLVVGNTLDIGPTGTTPKKALHLKNVAYATMGTCASAVIEEPLCVSRKVLRFFSPDAVHPYGCYPKRRNPVVNAGPIDAEYPESTTDLAGKPRVLEGRVDIGCYEHDPNDDPGLILFVR